MLVYATIFLERGPKNLSEIWLLLVTQADNSRASRGSLTAHENHDKTGFELKCWYHQVWQLTTVQCLSLYCNIVEVNFKEYARTWCWLSKLTTAQFLGAHWLLVRTKANWSSLYFGIIRHDNLQQCSVLVYAIIFSRSYSRNLSELDVLFFAQADKGTAS